MLEECEYVAAAVALGEGLIRGGGGGSIDGGGFAPASWRLGGAVGSVPDGKGAAVVEDGKPTRRVKRFPAPGYEKKSWIGATVIFSMKTWAVPGLYENKGGSFHALSKLPGARGCKGGGGGGSAISPQPISFSLTTLSQSFLIFLLATDFCFSS